MGVPESLWLNRVLLLPLFVLALYSLSIVDTFVVYLSFHLFFHVYEAFIATERLELLFRDMWLLWAALVRTHFSPRHEWRYRWIIYTTI